MPAAVTRVSYYEVSHVTPDGLGCGLLRPGLEVAAVLRPGGCRRHIWLSAPTAAAGAASTASPETGSGAQGRPLAGPARIGIPADLRDEARRYSATATHKGKVQDQRTRPLYAERKVEQPLVFELSGTIRQTAI